MAILTMTNQRSDVTITPPPLYSMQVSTLIADRCMHPPLHQLIDSRCYWTPIAVLGDEVNPTPAVGDIVYSDEAKTILYNTSGAIKDYSVNVNQGTFISLDADSKFINQHCR